MPYMRRTGSPLPSSESSSYSGGAILQPEQLLVAALGEAHKQSLSLAAAGQIVTPAIRNGQGLRSWAKAKPHLFQACPFPCNPALPEKAHAVSRFP